MDMTKINFFEIGIMVMEGKYEEAVKKVMEQAGCDRKEAEEYVESLKVTELPKGKQIEMKYTNIRKSDKAAALKGVVFAALLLAVVFLLLSR